MQVVVVAGAMANKPFSGGEAWVRLSWVLGFARLGFRCHFVEQIAPASCVDAGGAPASFERSVNLEYFRRVTRQFGLSGRASLICGDGVAVEGVDRDELQRLAGDAVLVNISGNLRWRPLLDRFRRRVYVDIDPGFTQAWHAAGTGDLGLERHDAHFTIAENLGRPGCAIPAAGLRWRTVRQPVGLDEWPVSIEGVPDRFTTVARWRSPFGPLEIAGRRYGLKHHEFRRFAAVPRRLAQGCELALSITPADGADRALLAGHGWRLVDPVAAAGTPARFRRYVQRSGGELSVAQGVYVGTRSGWFSDRTVRYLASGKPVLVQDTGFGGHLPTGLGLVAFDTPEALVTGAASIRERYDEHRAAARAIAERCFADTEVLGRFAERVGARP